MTHDGAHRMTLVTNTVKGVRVHSLSCNDCTLTSGPLNGNAGLSTLKARMSAHQVATRTHAEVRRRNGG